MNNHTGERCIRSPFSFFVLEYINKETILRKYANKVKTYALKRLTKHLQFGRITVADKKACFFVCRKSV